VGQFATGSPKLLVSIELALDDSDDGTWERYDENKEEFIS
jgi:hypothetical protein